MDLVGLIPARGGSKRLPGKNLRLLGGKPLIGWTIETAQAIGDLTRVIVSSDDPEILRVAADYGAETVQRPDDLATDSASSARVALHLLDRLAAEGASPDGLILLQPTSPFRSVATVRAGIGLFRDTADPVASVSPVRDHPHWTFTVENGTLHPFLPSPANRRKQDLPALFVLNGAFYAITPSCLRRFNAFTPLQSRPLIMRSRIEAMDIDTPDDLILAEAMVLAGLIPPGAAAPT